MHFRRSVLLVALAAFCTTAHELSPVSTEDPVLSVDSAAVKYSRAFTARFDSSRARPSAEYRPFAAASLGEPLRST